MKHSVVYTGTDSHWDNALPLVKETDNEYIRLKITTKPGYNWKINYVILNVIKGY